MQQGLVQRNLVQLWSQGRAVAPHVRPKQCHAPGVAARPERCRVTLNAMLGHLGVSLARWRVAPGTNDILSPTRHWPHRTPPRRACRHCLIASGTRPRNNRRQGPSAKPAKLRLTQKLWPPRGRFSARIAPVVWWRWVAGEPPHLAEVLKEKNLFESAPLSLGLKQSSSTCSPRAAVMRVRLRVVMPKADKRRTH